MAYKYRAYTRDKRIVQGIIDASAEGVAEEALYRAGYQRVLSLKEVRPRLSLDRAIPSLFGVRPQDVIDFLSQLATLIESGISLPTALQLLEGQTSRASLKKIIAGVAAEIQDGYSLSQAFRRYPQVFSDTHCQVIRASEQTGSLEVGLRQVAGYLEKRIAMAQRIRRAVAYPLLVLVMALGVCVLLVTVALPPLVRLFTSLGVDLPWTTSLIIHVADFIISYKFYLGAGIFLVIVVVAGYIRLPAGKLGVHRLMLTLPVIGVITIQRSVYYFCETSSVLLKAGLPLPQVMDIVLPTVGNLIIRQELRQVRERVLQGEGLSLAMASVALLPRLVVEMVAVGEKTGNIDATLATLADYYRQRVDQKINVLTAVIEPFLIVAVGLVVALIALSMIMPLYSILRTV